MMTLNKKEQIRLMVLNKVETDKMTSREAAEVLGLSTRQVRRILVEGKRKPTQFGRIMEELGIISINCTLPSGER